MWRSTDASTSSETNAAHCAVPYRAITAGCARSARNPVSPFFTAEVNAAKNSAGSSLTLDAGEALAPDALLLLDVVAGATLDLEVAPQSRSSPSTPTTAITTPTAMTIAR